MAIFTAILFFAATITALGAIGSTLRQYGGAALAAPARLAACPATREFRYTLVETKVRILTRPKLSVVEGDGRLRPPLLRAAA